MMHWGQETEDTSTTTWKLRCTWKCLETPRKLHTYITLGCHPPPLKGTVICGSTPFFLSLLTLFVQDVWVMVHVGLPTLMCQYIPTLPHLHCVYASTLNYDPYEVKNLE